MIPEIELLAEFFSGKKWDKSSQIAFIDKLAESDFFEGKGSAKNKDLSARDRINRAPKAFGFVDLKPTIQLTEAGNELISGKRPQEIFLRQLLKFQLPSPYHEEDQYIQGSFFIKPYLEIFRLIYDLGYITFDEFKLFAVQMIDYREYDSIKNLIISFRKEKQVHIGHYKQFVETTWNEQIKQIYKDRIEAGETRTRETNDSSLNKFIKTKKSNIRDYTDACFRYLRYTEYVSISHQSRTITIADNKTKEIEFILKTVPRDPVYIFDEVNYKRYLFSSTTPVLYSDNYDNIIDSLMRIGSFTKRELQGKSLEELKDLHDEIVKKNKAAILDEQIEEIKSYAQYLDIIDTYNEIIADEIYDAPLMLEYNTWRAMTMLDGGTIKPNLKFDDIGKPLSTAVGNKADIECYYDNFVVSVEVTMQQGKRQYETEGEPVSRHYGDLKRTSGKDAYCLFIAPKINPAAFAHFYGLNHISINMYGGKSKIIPLELDQFMKMIENAYTYKSQPTSKDFRKFLDNVMSDCDKAESEDVWKDDIQRNVDCWLS